MDFLCSLWNLCCHIINNYERRPEADLLYVRVFNSDAPWVPWALQMAKHGANSSLYWSCFFGLSTAVTEVFKMTSASILMFDFCIVWIWIWTVLLYVSEVTSASILRFDFCVVRIWTILLIFRRRHLPPSSEYISDQCDCGLYCWFFRLTCYLNLCTMWTLAVVLTFWRYMLPPSSGRSLHCVYGIIDVSDALLPSSG